MAAFIHVKIPNSAPTEDAAIKTALDTFIAACHSATAHHVDCGGTTINNLPYACDEGVQVDLDLPQGTPF